MRKFTEEEMKIADYNGDGNVDLYDAIEIAKFLVTGKPFDRPVTEEYAWVLVDTWVRQNKDTSDEQWWVNNATKYDAQNEKSTANCDRAKTIYVLYKKILIFRLKLRRFSHFPAKGGKMRKLKPEIY